MGKAPADQFYFGDFERDMSGHPLEVIGAWSIILCKTWFSDTRGRVTKSPSQWARIFGKSETEAIDILRYIQDENIGTIPDDLDNPQDKITVINRRQERDWKARLNNRDRQKTFREKGGGSPERWTAIRVSIMERDEYMCAYCGRKATCVDHIIPKSRGGDERDKNLVACCRKCNLKKNNKTPEEANMQFWRGFNKHNLESNIKVTPPSSTSSSPSKITTAKTSVFSLPDFLQKQTWELFLAHRKQIKHPITEKAFSSFVEKFRKLHEKGWPPDRVVDVMVEKGWRWFQADWVQEPPPEKKVVDLVGQERRAMQKDREQNKDEYLDPRQVAEITKKLGLDFGKGRATT